LLLLLLVVVVVVLLFPILIFFVTVFSHKHTFGIPVVRHLIAWDSQLNPTLLSDTHNTAPTNQNFALRWLRRITSAPRRLLFRDRVRTPCGDVV
jgi:hypothetical protein